MKITEELKAEKQLHNKLKVKYLDKITFRVKILRLTVDTPNDQELGNKLRELIKEHSYDFTTTD